MNKCLVIQYLCRGKIASLFVSRMLVGVDLELFSLLTHRKSGS